MQKELFAVASLATIIFLASTNLVAAQVHSNSTCPKVTPQPNINLDQYLGTTWWVHKKIRAYYIEGDHCLTRSFRRLGSDTYSVNISQIQANNQRRSARGTGKVIANGQFLERFENSPGVDFTYWILATVPKTHAVLFRCDKTATGSDQYMWLLTYDPKPKAEVVKAAEDAIKAHGFSTKDLELYDNSNCE